MSWGYIPIRGQGKKCVVCNEEAVVRVEAVFDFYNLCKTHCRGLADDRKTIGMMKRELEKKS